MIPLIVQLSLDLQEEIIDPLKVLSYKNLKPTMNGVKFLILPYFN